MIEKLATNEVFVFGSNLAGKHIAGAARQAREQFGAVDGTAKGVTGQCYTFPTLGTRLEPLRTRRLLDARDTLYRTCKSNPDKRFLLTKIGCGIAGYPEPFMKTLFTNPPDNLILPDDWIQPKVVTVQS